MSLSQVQIIKALGEALAWFERELSWSVPQQELRHLTGRIGELYAAMITRGQMALGVNQHGYDVVSAEGEHISVKTITTSTNVSFTAGTLDQADRVMVLRINVEEGEASIEEIFDGSREEMIGRCSQTATHFQFMIAKPPQTNPIGDLKIVASAERDGTVVQQLENGTIVVEVSGIRQHVAMPVLKALAERLGVDQLNAAGNKRNTRQLGAAIIAALLP